MVLLIRGKSAMRKDRNLATIGQILIRLVECYDGTLLGSGTARSTGRGKRKDLTPDLFDPRSLARLPHRPHRFAWRAGGSRQKACTAVCNFGWLPLSCTSRSLPLAITVSTVFFADARRRAYTADRSIPRSQSDAGRPCDLRSGRGCPARFCHPAR